MDDFQLIEIVEALRHRLREELPDLDARLERLVRCDFCTASPILLQECLMLVVFGLDSRVPGQAREIQRIIAAAEAVSAEAAIGRRSKSAAWLVEEQDGRRISAEDLDPGVGQAIRYLALPPVQEPVTRETGASMVQSPAVKVPSRIGRELSRCVNARQAVACVRRRLPQLKTASAYDFLVTIGYPVASPTPEALRFCRYLGLLGSGEAAGATAEKYNELCERASILTGIPIAHVGYLISLYTGGVAVTDYKPVCGRRARCEVCTLNSRCSHFQKISAEGLLQNGNRQRTRSIKEWAVDERPRERMLAGERLANSELLAIILRTGSGRQSAVELGREIMNEFGTLHDLEKATPQDIVSRMRGKGIGPAKAVEICAALELGRRVAQPAADTRLGLRQVSSSRDIFELCRLRYKAATQEEFLLLILNTKNRIQKEVPVSLGTLNSSIVHPRDVFGHALREAAAAVIFVHNHPSGDPRPSDEDILLTARLVDIGKLLGIQVLDHVIVGSHEYYSSRITGG